MQKQITTRPDLSTEASRKAAAVLVSIFLLAGALISSIAHAEQQDASTASSTSSGGTETASSSPSTAAADAVREQIENRRSEIEALEKEIEKDRQEINRLSGQRQTLGNEVKILDLSRAKLAKDISVTENKIRIADTTLASLSGTIGRKEAEQARSIEALSGTLRAIQAADGQTFQEALLAEGSLSAAFADIDMMASIQSALSAHLSAIRSIKAELESRHSEEALRRQELADYQSQLSDQKRVVDYTRTQRNSVLLETKEKESEYQKLLKEKLAKKEAFERELLEFEGQLRLITDPSSLPPPRPGLIRWPLSKVRITQIFGDTDFSRANPGVYSGSGHNGIDLAAPIGTPILAAEDGTVVGTGDTDTVCKGASYGKWILVRHASGLSTLYAHLSLIKVSEGQEVNLGQALGYAGVTGYTTGPHLHFTVYATQGVQIVDRKSKVCGGTYRMPVADLRAYLNPLLYLPEA